MESEYNNETSRKKGWQVDLYCKCVNAIKRQEYWQPLCREGAVAHCIAGVTWFGIDCYYVQLGQKTELTQNSAWILKLMTTHTHTHTKMVCKVCYLHNWCLQGGQDRHLKQVWHVLREQGKETGLIVVRGWVWGEWNFNPIQPQRREHPGFLISLPQWEKM